MIEAHSVIQFLWAKPATITCCDDCVRLFARRYLDICHCVIIQYESDPTQHTHQAQVVAVISLGTSAPPTLLFWPCPIRPLLSVWATEATLGMKCHKYHSNEKVDSPPSPHEPKRTPHTSCIDAPKVKSQPEDGPHIGPKHVVVVLV